MEMAGISDVRRLGGLGELEQSGSQRPRGLTEECSDAGGEIRLRPGASARSSGDRPARAALSTSGNGHLAGSTRGADGEDCDELRAMSLSEWNI